MNKQELISRIAKKSGMAKKDVETVINGFLDEVSEALSAGEKVQLIGFGTFEARKRSGRKGRNPQTGDVMQIPESTVPTFRAGSRLRQAVK
ncbi:MAG: HU family DNA-binding protein [Planifilum sp.]|jgi:DNA-binding protein HU-beta